MVNRRDVIELRKLKAEHHRIAVDFAIQNPDEHLKFDIVILIGAVQSRRHNYITGYV